MWQGLLFKQLSLLSRLPPSPQNLFRATNIPKCYVTVLMLPGREKVERRTASSFSEYFLSVSTNIFVFRFTFSHHFDPHFFHLNCATISHSRCHTEQEKHFVIFLEFEYPFSESASSLSEFHPVPLSSIAFVCSSICYFCLGINTSCMLRRRT